MAGQPDLDRPVRADRRGSTLWITLDRPERKNALTGPMRDHLADLMDEASGQTDTRCVVIRHSGEGFCAGADLAQVSSNEGERTVGDMSARIQGGWQRLITSILDCRKPVIASVGGVAAGGGFHLAMACDIVIAAETARFISVFVRRGLAPDGAGAYLLTRLVGMRRAKEITFLGDAISAEDALAMGLVNRVVGRGNLDETVEDWADRLSRGPTKAIWAAKQMLNRALDVDRSTALFDEAHLQELITHTDDVGEGMRSFTERRQPEFRGR